MSAAIGGFLDTNVLIYAFTTDRRSVVAQALLAQGGVISVQCLNEFANVARRKLGMNWPEVHDAVGAIRILCRTILPLDVETHAEGLRVAEQLGFSIFDSMMIAAALRAGCNVLYSEDMHHGMAIDRQLRIVDPFRDA